MIEEEKMKKLVLILLLLVMVVPTSFADDRIEVTLPGFDVTLNGDVVENASEAYPFIVYKGITYLPMTWDMSYALGLELKWNEITGLEIRKRDKVVPLVQKHEGVNKSDQQNYASLVTFPVNVNGTQIDNKTEDYPLLNFRNITYFPMTYAYMVGEFNAGYKWSDEKGLKLAADNSLEMMIPEPFTLEFEFSDSDFPEDSVLSNEMAIVEAYKDDYRLQINFGTHPELDGYVIDSEVNFLDQSGNYICTEDNKIRAIYNGLETSNWAGYSNYFGIPMFAKRVQVKVTIEPIEFARARAQKYADIEIMYFNDQQISLEALKNMGAVYIESFYLSGFEEDYPSDLLEYDLIGAFDGRSKDDTEKRYKVVAGSGGEPRFTDRSDLYKILNSLTSLYIDGLAESNRLTGKNGESVLFTGFDHGIRLYDKDKKLIKVLISQKAIDVWRK